MDEHQPLRDQCLSARAHVKAGLRKSSETRTHCHGILATVSVSQVTGTDITSCWLSVYTVSKTARGWCVSVSRMCVPAVRCPTGELSVRDFTHVHRVCVCVFRQQTAGTYEESESMCACGQPHCTFCQGKHGQLMPSGRTTWHKRALYGSMTYWSS